MATTKHNIFGQASLLCVHAPLKSGEWSVAGDTSLVRLQDPITGPDPKLGFRSRAPDLRSERIRTSGPDAVQSRSRVRL